MWSKVITRKLVSNERDGSSYTVMVFFISGNIFGTSEVIKT